MAKKSVRGTVKHVFEIVVNDDAQLMVVDTQNADNVVPFPRHDLGQVIEIYRKQGFRYTRNDDRNWLIKIEGWEAINEVVDPHDNVAYRKGDDA